MPALVEEIRAERDRGRPIFAVKGAHDFLCRAGIQPDLWMCVDPRDRTNLLQEANDFTTYLISSRCDASIFEALKEKRVMVCHTWAKEEHCQEYEGKLLLGGGSTSGLRAITAGYALGFSKFVLYGYDSCLDKDRATKRFTGEAVEANKILDVIVDGKRFWTNGAMAQQAHEFQDYYTAMPDLQIEVKGGGLIAAILDARRKRGYPA
jgi:hypothetical protein